MIRRRGNCNIVKSNMRISSDGEMAFVGRNSKAVDLLTVEAKTIGDELN